MTAIGTIFLKELRWYFQSLTFFIITAIYMLLFGLLFSLELNRYLMMMFTGRTVPVHDYFIEPLLWNCAVLLLMFMPFLTMRLFAEERRQGTLELLFTSPLRASDVVLGKFLAMLALCTFLTSEFLLMVAILNLYAKIQWRVVLVGYLGILLLASAFTSVGMFLSSLTFSQAAAAFLTWGALLLFWLLMFAFFGAGENFLTYLSFLSHLEDFFKGLLQGKHLVYFLTFTFFWLFLTNRSVEAQGWR
ncbi:MAG: ABC transporter permease [bacterium JZ-2024 1]